jgi:hypothetical protein
MTVKPAMARAASISSGSQRTWLFDMTVTGRLVMVGSSASARHASGFTRWEGN